MEIDFSPKKVWNDLVESKENLKYFIFIGLVLIAFSIADEVFKIKTFSSIGGFILNGYFVLMVNNIIHNKKPILENFDESQDEKRNLFLVSLKGLGINIAYALALVIIGAILFLTFFKLLMLSKLQSMIALSIVIFPIIILTFICDLLFAENLIFGDAFNLKKAIKIFKITWSKYIKIFLISILFFIIFLVLAMIILAPIYMLISVLFKSYPETSKLVIEILNSVFGTIGGIIIYYWVMNAAAQVYKYSLEKMN